MQSSQFKISVLFYWFQNTQPLEAYSWSGQIKPFGDHQDHPSTMGVGYLNSFHGCLLPYTNAGTVQEISEISCPREDIPVQSTVFQSVHCIQGAHCISKGGETDVHIQGCKNPTVPRRLVGENHIPMGLSPAYTRSSENMPRIRLAGEFRKSELEQAFDLVGYQFDLMAGRVPPTPDRWQNLQDKYFNTVTAGLSGPAVHVSDRFNNSHRKASSSRLTSWETHTVASQKKNQVEGTRATRKGDSNIEILAPTFTMVAAREQCPYRPTITPNKHALQSLPMHQKKGGALA